jgi:aminoglycoside phosphotransferase (APT) family kinase protein
LSLEFAVPRGTVDPAALEMTVSTSAMLEAFRRYLPPRDHGVWARCELDRVRYSPGRSWQVLYRLWKEGERGDASPHFIYAEFVPAARSLRRFLELRDRRGTAAPSGFVAELNMIYWRYPADPRLDQLPAVYEEGSWTIVSYVPGRSCVLSGVYAGEPTILKLYEDDRAERVGHVLAALRHAGVTAPRVLHVDQARRLLVLEHVPGLPFWSQPQAHLSRDVMGAMARELVHLHDTRLPDETRVRLPRIAHVTREWGRFQNAVRELSEAFPGDAARLERLQHMLEPPEETPTPVLLHGSFHPAQFLIHEGIPRLIDFDSICLGDPMYDLARFASHLYDRGAANGFETREVERAVSAFRSAYIAAAAHFDAPRWFWHRSLSLVAKRAHQVLVRLDVDALQQLRHLITIAEQNAVSIVRG